jgi:deoxyribonuclease IV
MSGLLFGTGGIPRSTPKPANLLNGLKRLSELGLGVTEMEFVYGVRMADSETSQVAAAAQKYKIRLTAHAPYYINLNAHENDKLVASQERLVQTARVASACGANSVAFHCAFYLKDNPQDVFNRLKPLLSGIVQDVRRQNKYLWLRPELMGKHSQFGSLEELLSLCSEVEGIAPCIDFAHLHARTGKFNTYYEFKGVLNQVEKRLGRAALDNLHIHLSGIQYSAAGELNHLNLRESDMNYTELLQALKEQAVQGVVICESPNLEEDALHLLETYNKV